jgi:hypothetical protein
MTVEMKDNIRANGTDAAPPEVPAFARRAWASLEGLVDAALDLRELDARAWDGVWEAMIANVEGYLRLLLHTAPGRTEDGRTLVAIERLDCLLRAAQVVLGERLSWMEGRCCGEAAVSWYARATLIHGTFTPDPGLRQPESFELVGRLYHEADDLGLKLEREPKGGPWHVRVGAAPPMTHPSFTETWCVLSFLLWIGRWCGCVVDMAVADLTNMPQDLLMRRLRDRRLARERRQTLPVDGQPRAG